MEDFNEMSLESLQNYDGPAFYASVRHIAPDGKSPVWSDLCSVTEEKLMAKIRSMRTIEWRRMPGTRYQGSAVKKSA